MTTDKYLPATASTARVPMPGSSLSPAEIRVLRVLAEGVTDKVIGRRLGVHYRTVNTHLKHIFVKLDTHSRVGAVIRAMRMGAIRLEDIA